MFAKILVVVAVFANSGTLAAPARKALATNDLLTNAQGAQDLNAQFSGLKLSDACSGQFLLFSLSVFAFTERWLI